MDEVKVMARAGENVGKMMGTGLRSAREGATRAGRAGYEASRQAAARAERELASHGFSADEIQERLARKATGKSRKQLAKETRKARKEWEKKAAKSRKQRARNTRTARKELASRIDPGPQRGRRKWPWLLLLLAGLAAGAVAVLSRRPEELPVAQAEPERERFPQHDPDQPGGGRHDGRVSDTTARIAAEKDS